MALRGTTSDPTEGNDKVTIGYPVDNYARTLIIDFDVENVFDQIRVITAVPEPSERRLGRGRCRVPGWRDVAAPGSSVRRSTRFA